MSFEFETSSQEEMQHSGGTYLSTPGKYHATITQVRENAGPKGEPIEGFSFELSILAGTQPGQEEKLINLTLWNPKLNGSEKSQAMDRKKQTAFAIAANLIDPNKLGGKVSCDLNQAVGAQIIVDLVPQEKDGEKSDKFLQLNYANIYHVDDPEAASVPRSAEAIALIQPNQRHTESWFAFKASKQSSHAASTPTGQVPTTREATQPNWADI